ncbi:MAG TPA: hypothetical protein VH044_13760, partial [Polyangiaceae bacterium]|nr:hypothetical protein [Polyangiaceae bacterium]
ALVDLDRPIDFAVAITGGGTHLGTQIAAAGGVRDLEAAKAALGQHYKLVPADNGVLLIQGAGKPGRGGDGPDDQDRSSDDDDSRVCELAPAYGPSATRLVCAWDPKALAALGPWLTRGATRVTTTTDAHVDVRMQPLKPTINEERRLLSILLGTIMGGRLGLSGVRDLAQSAGGDLADFGTDLDTATLDVVLSDPGAAATLSLKFSASASALGRLITANADRSGPPPAAFWQMPGDSDFALFDRGIDAKELARGRDLALEVVEDKLAEDGVKDGDRRAVKDALGALVSPAALVYASGMDLDAARKALTAEKALPDSADIADRREAGRASAQALAGWRVVEIDDPATARADALKTLTAAWGRVSTVYKAKGGRCVALRSAPLPKMPKGITLPKDTQHYALDVPLTEPLAPPAPKGKGKPAGPDKPLSLDVFLVPDGPRSWVGVGGDTALLVTKLAAAVAGSGDASLRARPELAGMKDAVVGAAGFFTARGLPEAAQQIATFGGDPGGFSGGVDVFDGVAQLPHQGTTPIPFSLTAPAASPGSAVATLQVSRGTIDDMLVTILKHGF